MKSKKEDTYFRILRLLHANPDLTQRELAAAIGLSVGTLNYCLKALIDMGWVKMQNFAESKNKLRYIYLLTPQGAAEKGRLAVRFVRRKQQEYEALRDELAAVKAEITEHG